LFLPEPWISNSYGVRCWRKFPIDQTDPFPQKRVWKNTQCLTFSVSATKEAVLGNGSSSMMAAVHHSLEIHGTVTVALPRSTYRGRSRTSQEPEAAALGRAILPNCLHCTQPLRQAASGHTVSNAVDIASLCPRSGETPEALEQDRLRQRVPCPVGRRETQRTRWPRTHTAFIHGHSLRGRTLLLPLAKPSHPKYWSRAGKVESRRDGFPSPIMVAEAIWKFLPSEYGSTPRCAKRPVQAGSTSRVLDGDTTSHNFINRHYTGCGTRRGNTMASR
ncbi:unnamed protein product, partial [Ectocarpus sp. 12 AP-2014]